MCRLVLEAAAVLERLGVAIEVIDLQTLDPLDLRGAMGASVARTGALVVADEDIPGGASAHILRHALEVQAAQDRLEVPARTVTSTAGRTPVGQDGDHYTKPNVTDVVRTVYAVARERDPERYGEVW
jgi:pyruvate/2-oxoglutarate/acetoin dehydrogenase E1 component